MEAASGVRRMGEGEHTAAMGAPPAAMAIAAAPSELRARETERDRERKRVSERRVPVSVFMHRGARWQARAAQRSHTASQPYARSAIAAASAD